MTKKLSSDHTELCSFMSMHVNEGDSVDVWNSVRQDAKELFSSGTISGLDACGYIKEFYLSPSAKRLI